MRFPLTILLPVFCLAQTDALDDLSTPALIGVAVGLVVVVVLLLVCLCCCIVSCCSSDSKDPQLKALEAAQQEVDPSRGRAFIQSLRSSTDKFAKRAKAKVRRKPRLSESDYELATELSHDRSAPKASPKTQIDIEKAAKSAIGKVAINTAERERNAGMNTNEREKKRTKKRRQRPPEEGDVVMSTAERKKRGLTYGRLNAEAQERVKNARSQAEQLNIAIRPLEWTASETEEEKKTETGDRKQDREEVKKRIETIARKAGREFITLQQAVLVYLLG